MSYRNIFRINYDGFSSLKTTNENDEKVEINLNILKLKIMTIN